MKVKIEKLDHFGRGICYIDGKICFVEDTLPGEVVNVKVILDKKKFYLGKVKDFYEVSNDRINEVCPYKDKCGGCDLSHLKYEKENEYKCLKVKEIMSKYGNISSSKVLDCVYGDEYNYRNKVSLHGLRNMIGYYKKNSNDIVPISKCLLLDDKINKIISILNEMDYHNNYNSVVIKCSNDGEEVLVSINGEVRDYEKLFDFCDCLIINGESLKGEDKIISFIGTYKYEVGEKGFFQVNKSLTSKLYDEVRNIVKDSSCKRVLDLYCGSGTIGIYISDLVDEVIGVEVFEDSIVLANRNKELNNIKNISFINDKVENVIDKINDNIDFVIVDPPRSGLDNKTIDVLLNMEVKDIVYVSCDPVTLARDIKLLSDKYEVCYIKPFNMFSRTYHVENVCYLKLK